MIPINNTNIIYPDGRFTYFNWGQDTYRLSAAYTHEYFLTFAFSDPFGFKKSHTESVIKDTTKNFDITNLMQRAGITTIEGREFSLNLSIVAKHAPSSFMKDPKYSVKIVDVNYLVNTGLKKEEPNTPPDSPQPPSAENPGSFYEYGKKLIDDTKKEIEETKKIVEKEKAKITLNKITEDAKKSGLLIVGIIAVAFILLRKL